MKIHHLSNFAVSSISLLLGCLTLLPIQTNAFTTDFLPGDSHFTTDLSQRSLKQIKSESGLQFDYYVFAGHTMLCGHAGFLTLKIEDDNSKLKNNYLKTASILFEIFKPDIDTYNTPSLVEEDYFPVFVYNRDFDFKHSAIGPRYNEDWESVQLNLFGLPHAIYPGFTRDTYLLKADFQNSKKIRPLDLNLPLPPIRKYNAKMKIPGAISTPIRIKGSKVQLLILAGGSYEISNFAKTQPLRTLFRITEDSIERFETDFKGKWQKVALNAPRNKASDKVRATLKTLEAVAHAISVFGYRHGWNYDPPLSALVSKPSDFPFEKNEQDWMPFFKQIPKDEWGNTIMWPFGGSRLISSGPDGKFYTDDDLTYSIL